MEYRIALGQIAPHLGEVDRNLELAADRVRAASAEGADLLVLPELALTGYLLQDLVPDVAMQATDPRLANARRRCAGHARGGRLRRGDRRPSLREQRGARARRQRPRSASQGLPADVRHCSTRVDSRDRATGSAPSLSARRLGRIGLSVCEDFWHPVGPAAPGLGRGVAAREHRRRSVARARAVRAGLAAIAGWHKMQDTYALLGTVPLAFCNRVGNEEGLTFWGGSRLVAADGSIVVEAPLWEEALVDRHHRHR